MKAQKLHPLRGHEPSGSQDRLGVLAQIVFCFGAHGVTFYFIGKSRHGARKSSSSNAPVVGKTPFQHRQTLDLPPTGSPSFKG